MSEGEREREVKDEAGLKVDRLERRQGRRRIKRARERDREEEERQQVGGRTDGWRILDKWIKRKLLNSV